ncbi:NAD(P)H-quinone oxidoreductase chain 4 [Streptomyces violarus]
MLESGTLARFAVLDLLLFFLAFEMVLVPMYFLIARWGGEGRAGPPGNSSSTHCSAAWSCCSACS